MLRIATFFVELRGFCIKELGSLKKVSVCTTDLNERPPALQFHSKMKTLVNCITAWGFLLVFVIAGGCTLKTPKTPPPPSLRPPRRNLAQEERNKKMVVDFYQTAIGNGDLSVIDTCVAVDLIQHNPNVPGGREPFHQFMRTFPIPAPGQMVIEHVVSEGDYVWIHSRNSLNGTPLALVDIYRVRNNLIVEHFDVIQSIPATSANPHPMFNDMAAQYQPQCQFVKKTATN